MAVYYLAMNLSRVLIALSVAFNVGLLTFLILHASTGRWGGALSRGNQPADVTDIVSAEIVASDDYVRMFRRLRDIGFTEESARRIIVASALVETMDEMRRHRGRMAEEFWRPDVFHYSDQWVALIEAQRAREAALIKAFGSDALTIDPLTAPLSRILPGLPLEKLRAIRMIEEDYAVLTSRIHSRFAGGVMFPEDREALRVLQQEKREDLAAILTLAQIEELELRNSETSHALRHQLRVFEPTEEEFRTIFRLQREIDLEFGVHPSDADDETWNRFREAGEEMLDQLRDLLGEERYADFERSQDYNWRQLVQITQRLGIDRDRANEVSRVRQLVERKQREIQYDQDLSPEERIEAHRLLFEETRASITAALTERGYEVYRESAGWWLRNLEQRINLPMEDAVD